MNLLLTVGSLAAAVAPRIQGGPQALEQALGTAWTPGVTQLVLVVLAGAVTWISVPAVARLARRWNALANPGGRSVHTHATPLLGGLAIALPLLVGMVALGDSLSLSFAGASVLILVAGMIDDLRGIRARTKLFVQMLAVLLLFWGGHRVMWLDLPPVAAPFTGLLELFVLTFWVVLVTNAMNLADGLDGLATGYGLIAALTCLVVGIGNPIAAILAGALLGFLPHNLSSWLPTRLPSWFPRARIFLGDTGSLLLGLVVAVLLLGDGRGLNLPVALAALALPLGDVALSCVRRWLRGKPIFSADRGHVHHLLLRVWRRVPPVLAALLALAALQAAIGIVLPNLIGVMVVALLWVAFLGYLLAVNQVRWQKILTRRMPFRRIHLLARYAEKSMRLAESPTCVQTILTRVEEDLGERSGSGSVHPGHNGSEPAAEGHDPVYEEERQTVLKAILDTADGAFARFDKQRAAGSCGDARAHFVVRHVDDLIQIAPVVRALRDGGRVESIVVNTGCGKDLDPALLPSDVEQSIDLNVPGLHDVEETERVMERYESLLDERRPDLIVVVGGSNAAVACALVARRRGIRLVHIAAEHRTHADLASAGLNSLVAASIADLHVKDGVPPERKAESTRELVPQIEQLLEVSK